MNIGQAYRSILSEVPNTVTALLACKGRTPDEVVEAIEAGATDLGENYVQEAQRMIDALGGTARQVRWHLIGDLQTNKINKALALFDVIQTVDSIDKAQALHTRATRLGRTVSVLVEINSAREPAKAGVLPDWEGIEPLIRGILALDRLELRGLMTMGPAWGEAEDSRPSFALVRGLFDRIRGEGLAGDGFDTLSMGMSDSYRIAIEEGATMVRLGTIIFGQR